MAESFALAGREQGIGRASGAFGQPDLDGGDGDRDQRRNPVLASLADAVDVGAGAELDVAAIEPDQLGGSQPGLGGEHDQRVVAAAGPSGALRRGEQRIEFVFGEECDDRFVGALGWDREHPGDQGGVFGVAQAGVVVERVDRCQPGVAGADGVVAVVLEMVEERDDQRRVEIGDVELVGLFAGALGGESEQQPDRVPVGGDRVRAGLALADEIVGEEGLEGRGERAHCRCPICSRCRCSRSPASASSSGAADKYQKVFEGFTCPR